MIFRLDEDVITVLWFALSSLVNLNKLPENVKDKVFGYRKMTI